MIITLLTDFGLKDNYVGVMKGVILRINPSISIIDISHSISPHNIKEAAFVLLNSYEYFPSKTVHVVVVDPGVGGRRKPIVVKTKKYFFVGPDNGVFTHIYENNAKVYEIKNSAHFLAEPSSTFHARDIFAPVAAHISKGVDVSQIGKKVSSYERFEIEKPEISEDKITGKIVYVDRFGNLVTNIPKEVITKKLSTILIKDEVIDKINDSYDESKKGTLLAIIGSTGNLEISVNQGSAKNFLNITEENLTNIKIYVVI